MQTVHNLLYSMHPITIGLYCTALLLGLTTITTSALVHMSGWNMGGARLQEFNFMLNKSKARARHSRQFSISYFAVAFCESYQERL